MTFQPAAAAMNDDLIKLRRELHRQPELGLHLPRTQQTLLAALADLPLEISTGRSLSSITGVLRGRRPGPAVLLRADMDALPVTETADVDYVSEVPGRMHACGHDLHMAILVGAARLLSGVQAELAGDVVFMFQPAEEGPGGAEPMIAEGVLTAAGEPAIAAYCLHVYSATFARGVFASRRGALGAASDTVRAVVRGAGGHGSVPFKSKDPIPAACEMVTALQTFVTRSFDIFDPVVITVGSFHAGTVDNVIPAEARFEATVRSFSADARDRAHRGVLDVISGIAAAHGLQVEIDYERGYPVTVNDTTEVEFAARTTTELFGADRFSWMDNPEPGSEDMSYVLEQVPGAYLNLGACPPGVDPSSGPVNHAAEVIFDDSVLADGAVVLAELARRRLELARQQEGGRLQR